MLFEWKAAQLQRIHPPHGFIFEKTIDAVALEFESVLGRSTYIAEVGSDLVQHPFLGRLELGCFDPIGQRQAAFFYRDSEAPRWTS